MDIVTVNGVEYEKASVIAKKFKYTSDYIGQLCRARKVDSQLVGRTWYVNPDSLKSHHESRYKKTPSDDKTFEYKVKINKSRIDVEPFLSKKTSKIINSSVKNFAKRIDWKPVKYEYDEAELLPRLLEEKKKINIDLAESSKILIKNTSKNMEMVAEELPSVALSGGLKISSLDENFAVEDSVFDVKTEENFLNGQKNKKENENIESYRNGGVLLTPQSVEDIKSIEQFYLVQKWLSLGVLFFLFTLMVSLVFVDFEIFATKENLQTSFSFSTEFLNLFFY
jgi:hypothetical protein